MASDLPRCRRALALAALALASCGETLIDHGASPELLALVCAPDRLACDGQCLACSPPENAHATCAAGGGCGFACEAGFNQCAPNACVPESPTSCGPSCSDCSTHVPLNAGPICNADHQCDFECAPGFLRSGDQCQRAISLSVGFEHTCAITADARMKCWGSNERGQLGNGTRESSAIPIDVPLPTPVRAMSAGYYHTCAVAADALYCWGDNTYGEVGDGTMDLRLSPTLVALPNVESVFAGGTGDDTNNTLFAHTCAIVTGGALWCWGLNGSGQLGDGTSVTRSTPAPVTVLPEDVKVTAAAIGERHTCALDAEGAVYCWGANDSGQLGTGTFSEQRSVAEPTIESGASMIAAGEAHSCALVGRTMRCWGLNAEAQVDPAFGPAAFPRALSPVMDGVPRPTRIAVGRAHSCGLDDSAPGPTNVCCFGKNDAGQLGGAGNEADVPLLAPYTAVAVGAGAEHTCVLTGEGGIQCWGSNEYGQLGNGVAGGDTTTPVYVSGR